jgi:hypothetical protein
MTASAPPAAPIRSNSSELISVSLSDCDSSGSYDSTQAWLSERECHEACLTTPPERDDDVLASVSHVGHGSTCSARWEFNHVDRASSVLVQCQESGSPAGAVACSIVADKEKRLSQEGPRRPTTTEWSGVWYTRIDQPLPDSVTERDLPDMVPSVHVDCRKSRIGRF